ncbi:succinylglutamate desuccinylase/aspartoacylase family protein [Undibacterium sp. FT137W]|uniref:Succinylglutamate desuccinylase/aspartoacylase family protein n=2 Tax=Undibacterium fentianense TaxID=2828728 RepID=A0A941E273_9BURK|nr:succinylglutamate desuccinylase/aspartoacylase family protein [Undibacterium fentianense]
MLLLSASLFSLSAHAVEETSFSPGSGVQRNVNHLKALQDWCKQVTPRLPKVSLNECRTSRLQVSSGKSFKGLPLMTRDFSSDPKLKRARKVLLIGGIHGDEKTATAVVFKWLETLAKNPTQEFQWKVAPLVNPDGLLAPKATRVNARGVDLNRNFPTPDWDKEALKYWEQKTKSDPRRYPGKTPVSEPESKWVFETITTFKPDVIISVHAPFGVLDLDGPAQPPTRFGRLHFNRVGVYAGSLGNYSGMHQETPVLTIELPHALNMPSPAETARIWSDMQIWIRNNVSVRKK